MSQPLEPNTDYVESSTGYVFTTDAASRVCRVQGRLLDEVGHRSTYQQRKVGRPDRLPTDDGGHFMATIFRGPGEAINLTAMDANLNRGAWKALENDWAQALRRGKEVSVVIEVKYAQNGGRAERFIVAYQITANRPGGASSKTLVEDSDAGKPRDGTPQQHRDQTPRHHAYSCGIDHRRR